MLTFEEDTHTYRVDGKVYPSVTQTMQKAGLIDLSMIPAATLEKARQEGKAVHRMVEAECKGETYVKLPEWLKPYQRAWHAFVEWSGFELWASEERLYNQRYGYATTLDLAGVPHHFKDGDPAIIELKRSFAGGKAINVQTSAQQEAWNICHRTDRSLLAKRRYGLRLLPGKTPPYQCLPFEDGSRDFQDFLVCLSYCRMIERYK